MADMKLPKRNYLDVISALFEPMWDKIKNNTFVNMFFPLKEVSEGNTEAILPAVVPGAQAVKTTAKAIQSGTNDITSRFLKFADAVPSTNPNYAVTEEIISQWPYSIQKQTKLLQDAGVDISKLDRIDIENAMNKRWNQLLEMSNKDRLVRTIPGYKKYNGELIENGQTKGRIKLSKYPDDLFHVDMITSFEPNKGIGRDLYDAGIITVKLDRYPGIVSGENLISAEKTTSTWKHYPDKKLLSNNGIQNTDGGKAKSGTPVYLLTNPSRQTYTKSILFNPEIIDDTGKMHIDLLNPDIYKTTIPVLWGVNLLYNKKKN